MQMTRLMMERLQPTMVMALKMEFKVSFMKKENGEN